MEALAPAEVPVLVKHVTLAIYKDGKLSGPRRERFQQAYAMACSTLAKQGYLTGNTDRVELTSQGRSRDRTHQRERGASGKRMMFDRLYAETFLEKGKT